MKGNDPTDLSKGTARSTYGAADMNVHDKRSPIGVRGRGKTGYPVPPDMWDRLGEASDPDDIKKSIEHLEDMKPDEFIVFLEKYKDLPLKGGLEVSEKVDGSARIMFGVEDGRLWVASKNGPRRHSPDEWPDKPMFRALRAAHAALASRENEIVSWFDVKKDEENSFLFAAEVLYTKIPNSIEYGPDAIVIHTVLTHGGVPDQTRSKKIAEDLIKSVGKLEGDWLFEYKRVIDPSEVMVDVKEEYDSIKQIHDELKKLEPDKLKAIGKGPYKAALEKFKSIQSALKKKLIGLVRNQKSIYGGGSIEGLVFRDLDSGSLVKLVDKEYFTKLNKFLWHYRELLDKGVKVGDKWQVGVMQKFRNMVADDVIGAPVAKTPGFVGYLQKFAKDLKFPESVSDDQKKADYVLAKYIETNGLMKGDFVKKFEAALLDATYEFTEIRNDWDSKKSSEMSYDVMGDDGKKIKSIKMDKLIKDRTDESFVDMSEFLDGIGHAVKEISSFEGDLTKKTALLKLMLGQNRFEKLAAGIKTGAKEMNEVFSAADQRIYDTFKEKLLKRGIQNNPQSLGSGIQGTAYDIGDDKIFKITGDEREAKTSYHLLKLGKDFSHLMKIYDVFKFPKLEGAYHSRYGIIAEKLERLSNKDVTAITFAVRCFDLREDRVIDKQQTWEELINDFIMEHGQTYYENVKEELDHAKEIGFDVMLAQLKEAGIKHRDLHPGNIMKKDGHVVAIDF
ncbi:MAG: hypothetical protein WC895_04715, partial [Candidatus Shapirobacteria bacterium]